MEVTIISGTIVGMFYWMVKAYIFNKGLSKLSKWWQVKRPLREITLKESFHRSTICMISIDAIWGTIGGEIFSAVGGQLAIFGLVAFGVMSALYMLYYDLKFWIIDSMKKKKVKVETVEEIIKINPVVKENTCQDLYLSSLGV